MSGHQDHSFESGSGSGSPWQDYKESSLSPRQQVAYQIPTMTRSTSHGSNQEARRYNTNNNHINKNDDSSSSSSQSGTVSSAAANKAARARVSMACIHCRQRYVHLLFYSFPPLSFPFSDRHILLLFSIKQTERSDVTVNSQPVRLVFDWDGFVFMRVSASESRKSGPWLPLQLTTTTDSI